MVTLFQLYSNSIKNAQSRPFCVIFIMLHHRYNVILFLSWFLLNWQYLQNKYLNQLASVKTVFLSLLEGDSALSQRSRRNGALCDYLQQSHCNPRAGLRVGEGVVVVDHRASAGGGDGMQLVVGQTAAEVAARGPAGAEERIVGVVHLIDAEHGLEAALVEGAVVRHERQSFDQRLDLPPHAGEHGCVVRVLVREPVYPLAEPRVVVGFGLDERVKRVGDDTAAHHHHTHAAYAAALPVGGLEVYGCKVGHNRMAATRLFMRQRYIFWTTTGTTWDNFKLFHDLYSPSF